MKADVYIYVLNAFLSCILKTPVENLEEICTHDECNASFGLSFPQYKNTDYISGPNSPGVVAS